jgi:hypothetical protein
MGLEVASPLRVTGELGGRCSEGNTCPRRGSREGPAFEAAGATAERGEVEEGVEGACERAASEVPPSASEANSATLQASKFWRRRFFIRIGMLWNN